MKSISFLSWDEYNQQYFSCFWRNSNALFILRITSGIYKFIELLLSWRISRASLTNSASLSGRGFRSKLIKLRIYSKLLLFRYRILELLDLNHEVDKWLVITNQWLFDWSDNVCHSQWIRSFSHIYQKVYFDFFSTEAEVHHLLSLN